MSPEVGELDETAVEEALAQDPDATLALLAAMSTATDERLRALARALAGRIALDLGRPRGAPRRGVGRIETARLDHDGSDLDIDASLDGILRARATKTPPTTSELFVRRWAAPDTAVALVIDRSGSMSGARLATAAVATAAAAHRAPEHHTIVAFNDEAVVVCGPSDRRRIDETVDDILGMRGSGQTNLALALKTACDQLDRTGAQRRHIVVLSDCRVTSGSDPVVALRAVDDVLIIAPADDDADAIDFASTIGARLARVAGPSDIPAAFASF